MKIAIGCDHGGFSLKEQLKRYLIYEGYDVRDVGTYSKDSCNYPEFAIKCAEMVKDGTCDFGVVVCTTGEGVAMTANKIKGIRAGIAYNNDVARLMREHNDANVIAFGANFTSFEEAKERIDIFLNARFFGGRHATRVQMIKDLEK
ncbi:MAG TPA: ribose 5-phosphate isomerase B [Erysipelotrichaceae bacterium]|nr:ribose 5-phosphate isomerase B [Erysipelotrichaceae bacterium]